MMGATFFMMNVAKPGVDKYQGMEALVMAGMVMLVACLLIVLICFLGGWILMEAFCLSTFGTTLGKWLLKVHIRNADGSRLSFKQGCVRGCKIWFRGMGLFIPIVGLVTHVMAFNRLKNHQITSWDEDDSLVVTHSTIGPARIAVVVGIFLAQNVISGILQLMSMSHRFPNPH
jgi:hypothetical protein